MPPDEETSRRLSALEVGVAGLVAREESCRDRIIEDRAEMRALREVVVGLASELKQATGDFTELRKVLEQEREDRKRTAEIAREREQREQREQQEWASRWRAWATPGNLVQLLVALTVVGSVVSLAWQGQATPEDIRRAVIEAQRLQVPADDGGAVLPDAESAEPHEPAP